MKNYFLIGILLVGLGLGFFFSTLNKDNDQNKQRLDNENKIVKKIPDKKNATKRLFLPKTIKTKFDQSLEHYFAMQTALSQDNLKEAKQAATSLKNTLQPIIKNNLSELKTEEKNLWNKEQKTITLALKNITDSKKIAVVRNHFETLSLSIETLINNFGIPKNQNIAKYHCPMTNKKGGSFWLQNSEGVQNPYHGSKMFKCGKKILEL